LRVRHLLHPVNGLSLERFGDRDLQALALITHGQTLLALGDVRKGMALVDEATMAAVPAACSWNCFDSLQHSHFSTETIAKIPLICNNQQQKFGLEVG